MKIKGIPYSQVKEKALENTEALEAYLEEKREYELQSLLTTMRNKAGINSSQVAKKMGVTQPAISKLEKNVSKASIKTLERYALACGASIKFVIEESHHPIS